MTTHPIRRFVALSAQGRWAWQRRARILLLATVFALAAPAAQAVIGSLDAVPAATLLLPYFEVDLAAPQGATTTLSVLNGGEAPVIVHFTLWTDLAVPTHGWDAYLTGYDAMVVDLRQLFVAGTVPATSHSNTTLSPVGLFSLALNPATGVGAGTTSCDDLLPVPTLPAGFLAHLQAAHTGQPSMSVFGGLCAGRDLGDNVARGFLTVDVMRACSLAQPGDAGYFADGGLGLATDENVLVGDYVLSRPGDGVADGGPLVHLEASASDPRTQPGQYTFYARLSGGADNREPLGSVFWARFSQLPPPGEQTSLLYWRDPKGPVAPFNCALGQPAPFPLGQNQLVVFDEQENPNLLGPLRPLPAASGRVAVGGGALPVPFNSGWFYLNLNTAIAGNPVGFGVIAQSWVRAVHEKPNTYAYGADGMLAAGVVDLLDPRIPTCDGAPDAAACGSIPLFADGFESGNTTAWSLTVP